MCNSMQDVPRQTRRTPQQGTDGRGAAEAAMAVPGGASPGRAEVGEGAVPNAGRLLAQAAALAADRPADQDLGRLVSRYWRLVPGEELMGCTPGELLAATVSHRELAAQRLPGEPRLRVAESTADAGRTVIEIVTDDTPFLVDSVTAALAVRDLDVHLLVHPVMVVDRDALGGLVEVRLGVEPDDAGHGGVVESWMRLEIDRIRDQALLGGIRTELARVLGDVREAVEDWPKMRAQALLLAEELAGVQLPVPAKDIADAVELLRWLVGDHFTFLGYREYRHVEEDGESLLAAVPGTGLGILRSDRSTPRVLSSLTPEAYARLPEKRLMIITKANSRATVHRSTYLDYVGIKTFDPAGNVVGERRFLGLLSSAAYRTSVRELPVVKRKVADVLDRSGLSPRRHSGKALLEILEAYPRDELFRIATDDLYRSVMGVLRLTGRQLRLFVRRDLYGRFISCLVHVPRERFTMDNRLKIEEILLRELNGVGVDCSTRVGESRLAQVHFTVRTDPADPPGEIDADRLAGLLSEATRLWDDDFRLALTRELGEERSKALHARYAETLPDTYKDGYTPEEAAGDVARLELLETPGQLAIHVFGRRGDAEVRFKVFRYGEPMLLSAVLPVLHSLGVRVSDERPYTLCRRDGRIYLYDFGLQLPAGSLGLPEVRPQMEYAFCAALSGETEIDGFNTLVLTAGLTVRQVVVLRAYTKYLRQAGTVHTQDYLQDTFCAHPGIAAQLVTLFEMRFDPRRPLPAEDRSARCEELAAAIRDQLDAVTSLDQDRILRAYLTLIQATLRTNFYQRGAEPGAAGHAKPYLAFKLDSQAIPELPAPRPKAEIFVYSPRFEGVHLRFGSVARGGLRWSERREDFRTEILGLVKAQIVKNAVIVPTGAKGGFVLKRPPAGADGERVMAEGVACYRQFVSALLDLTDNLDAGKIAPPAEVVRHDGDDPYLVVAADKGTATFSDIANEISLAYGFWLGDAFASGGSAGYDHKRMGITARGAWESVKRWFRDLGPQDGIDIQSQDFTAVGIGDMSGDVFGNGMLLSRHTRLVAAFDHRHIFIDPDPDPERSYVERQRLFELARSSWGGYDRALLSAGGGVWPRTAKSIPVCEQVRAALGIGPDAPDAMSPSELVRAILTAPVDLLWSGGVGTYVKASTESHADVGDKANDHVRVDGRDLRVRVVGEGGNLGLTQRGRIEFALLGGHIATDFIDNSAGVDCSDHEVNIKILLGAAIAAGELQADQRNALLAGMTGEVAELVLRDNYDQATALGKATAQSRSLQPVHRRLIADLERRGQLDRGLEALPTGEELEARAQAGASLTSPEFAVLLSHVKIALKRDILDSALPDEAWTHEVLVDYLPTPLRGRYAHRMAGHPLRREIVTTQLVNEAVNRGGTSFFYRAVEETGACPADVLRAYVIAREIYGLRELWRAVESLDDRVPGTAQAAVHLEVRRLLDRAVRWLVTSRHSPIDVPGEIGRLHDRVSGLLADVGTLLPGGERLALRSRVEGLRSQGLPEDVADRATRIGYGFRLLDIVETAHASGQDVNEAAGVYFVLSEHVRADSLLTKISALPREDRWQTFARMALRHDLYAALAGLTARVLAATSPSSDAQQRVDEWERANAASIARARGAIGDFDGSQADLAALSVLLRQIQTLMHAAA